MQSEKAQAPIFFTEFGSVKLVKEVHNAKAYSPVFVTESRIVKLVKEVQPEKAHAPICVSGDREWIPDRDAFSGDHAHVARKYSSSISKRCMNILDDTWLHVCV